MDKTENHGLPKWLSFLPPTQWLPHYSPSYLGADMVAGITLAAYAIPVSLAYATLAGLQPQVGIYGYLLGGLGYALLGSSRQLAVGPTSAISLMIASSIALMAGDDALRYAQIASLAAFTVAGLALISWALRLSVLVRLISDSILVGFKTGAGLTIAMTQLPSLFGVTGGGHNFFERLLLILGQLGGTNPIVLAVGLTAILAIVAGDRLFPGRPVALAVVCISIAAATLLGLPAMGVPITGAIPSGLPSLHGPSLRLRDVEGIVPLAGGVLLLAYIEGVSAARSFAAKHGYALDPRQEFLGIGAANLFAGLGQGYPVAGGLSQSAVNDKAGARSPLALVFASITLAICLLFLTGLLENLPKAVLAAVVLTAVAGLINFPELRRMSRVSRVDFYAATIALVAVLLLGILQGILLAALASIIMLLIRASRPHVAFLGRIPGTCDYSDVDLHPENEPLGHAIAFRPESNLIYVNADTVLQAVLERVEAEKVNDLKLVVCDLSASPVLDLAGSGMLHKLHAELATQKVPLRVVGARGRTRDLLQADNLEEKLGGVEGRSLDDLLKSFGAANPSIKQ
ncbi:SulP family inorganic anion transporter [Rhizobium johnstonii]|uniref:SulP family inorganic anion transporter n=1 Tax=Rhizobium TaxID=379 RepID=UPI001031DFE2|nr:MULTISPECIES: SulP family inorganic anion transporter [Rhizobium]MBB4509044.1 high affinity sulfate transporter 1 [Rhizobium leguminosarum]MBY5377861.1 SulP family inorganic anion transporter [Rhizobium leguminosarum]MCA2433027.1 SulP family inorganic anion transporter [Rhizobium leguminosarum]QIO69537.1 SulP family inorganic anion transporter [Rhizobium leguminosarum bv. trifolii]TBF26709.1 SulP family inorganic anion transporter [Rhizobium leguminosarum]